jgi:predicted phage terminase large subunit-like protein
MTDDVLATAENDETELPIGEVVKLCAIDNDLYCRTFFPKAFRQKSPLFQKEVWSDLEDTRKRYVNQIIFRGGAKTTLSRAFTSKRIAYGMSKTILYVGASEGAAVRSSTWLRRAVERNRKWAGTFGLIPGGKWTDTEFEIDSVVNRATVWCLFVGITGNIRGINFDDYRPDLIVLDDILTDENCATEEQREKVNDLIQGALRGSLAPVVDEPNAKMVMLTTPQNKADAAHKAEKDPMWTTIRIPVWTDETLTLPVNQQVARWPERQSTEEWRAEKLSYMSRNELSKFLREYEVKLVSKENSAFLPEWLKNYDIAPATTNVISIDPVPPPSDRELAKGLAGKDHEVIQAWGRRGDDYYLLESASSRGHQPDWTTATALGMALRHRVTQIVVEGVAYQRTLKWILEQEMQRRRIYYIVNAVTDKRPKYARITSTLVGLASQGKIHINNALHSEFALQFESFPNGEHDDLLDAAAMALTVLSNPFAAGQTDEHGFAEVLPFKRARGAP